jgi:hypothetical protein
MNIRKKSFPFWFKGLMMTLTAACIVEAQSLPYYDNFNDGNDGGWVKPDGGNWSVAGGVYTKDAVSMSYDGYYISYVGDNTWTDYTVSANARTVSSSTGWASLIFRVLGSGDYYTFQIEPATHWAKLERRASHSYAILQETTALTMSYNTWYELKVKVIGDSAYCYIDNVLIFSYKGIQILSGGAGLASWHMASEFDNFAVTSIASPVIKDTQTVPFYVNAPKLLPYCDDFYDGNDSGWVKPDGGNWTVTGGVYTKDAVSMSYDGYYISYVGDNTWTDYTMSANARTVSSSTGWASLIFRILDGGDYYTFQIEPATQCAKLERRTDHSYTILREIYLSMSSNTWYELKVKVIGDSAYCYIDNALIFSYKGIQILSGGAGLASWHMASEFDNFCVLPVIAPSFVSDSFTCDHDSGWEKPEGGNWTVHDGVYEKDSASRDLDCHHMSCKGDSRWKDYTVSVDVRAKDHSDGCCVMTYRVLDPGSAEGAGNYYTFLIEPSTNSARFGRCEKYLHTTLCERNDLSLVSNRWYKMKVKVRGDTAICYLDDVPLFNARGIALASGGAGLATWHMDADFDNFSVEGMTMAQGTAVLTGLKQKKRGFPVVTTSLRGVKFSLPEESYLTVKYYDVKGRWVATSVNSSQKAGEHLIAHPKGLATGNYVVSFRTGKLKFDEVVLISR